MCGITGALDLSGLREFSHTALVNMINAIAHRGPDDQQIHIEPGVALGACRLAILDLENGYQPIENETRKIWATFNGELFDYPTIRKELLARGHTLKTRCDTECWVHLYEDYQEIMFEKTKGQFAVALWDRSKRTLILGRDRVGICPLYYTVRNGWLLWGSEIKALLASGLVPAEADPKGIDHLFNFYGPGTHRTFFKDIKLLQPGCFLRIRNGNIECIRYWDLDFPNAGEERLVKNPNVLVDELDALLTSAVKRRLRANVPVVSYLSGGIDSSVIIDIASRLSDNPPPSFTIAMDKKTGPDENAHAVQVAKLSGSNLISLPMNTSKILNSFPDFTTAVEGPVIDTSCAALMQLATEIHRHGFKVALTGEGADEALAGYIWFKSQKISNWFGTLLPRLTRKLIFRTIYNGNHRGQPVPEKAFKGSRTAQQLMYEALNLSRETLYSDDMWERLAGHDPYTDLDLPNEKISQWDPLNQSIYVNYKEMLASMLLISKGDRIAMHSSVELRFPFLDEDVINFCASISPSYKLKGLTNKWLLRQLAARYLPASIANRPKSMFRSKLSSIFLNTPRPIWVDELLSEASLKKAGFFDPKVVMKEKWKLTHLPAFTPHHFLFDAMITCVITTQLWYHLFCGGGLCNLPVWTPARKVDKQRVEKPSQV